MKKIFFITVILLLILTACSSKQASVENNQEEEEQVNESKEEQSIEVDKGLFNVEVTLPASLFEDRDINEVIEEAKADGVKEVIQNADGSLTYKMSKSDHAKMLKEMEDDFINSIEEMKASGDFASIKDIEYNKGFTEFTVLVDRDAYENSFDGFVTFGLGISSMFYQLYNGVDPDSYKVTINIKDETTGEIFNTTIYPDSIKEE